MTKARFNISMLKYFDRNVFMGRPRLRHVLIIFLVLFLLLSILWVDVIETWWMGLYWRYKPPELCTQKEDDLESLRREQTLLKSQSENFFTITNERLCTASSPFLLTFIISAPRNFALRALIRNTWASRTSIGGRRVLSLFALGISTQNDDQRLIQKESKKFQDLIQGNFLDTYANLTLKTISILRWTAAFCPEAQYIMKVDDDVLLKYDVLIPYLVKSAQSGPANGEQDLYMGYLQRRITPIRDPDSKYFLPKKAYPNESYPDYCSGTAYVLSRSAARKIYEVTFRTPWFIFEDVYVGMCAQKAGVIPTHCSLFSGGLRIPYSRCCFRALIAAHHISPAELSLYWQDITNGPECSWISTHVAFGICKFKTLLNTVLS
ncbi:beta-1,3-galactosyltransferase 9 [Erpetoichthys calabaricus]|uniref:Hexosyltransferase n=1 Tax=Erpetoichthys calabaricus TaxID=27687 RepID=A0A8C4RF94_ERPCA|nr:beta-1,3-galactosyltransferase 9 [Erpetoichthys calabaricus]XP_028657624.1 beta-1,3-galactosyltransferase 9 [Erpetoichthys calabaricus]XP_028657632.1 beta-1,3-galactosyltransferase 9 [Erpetoichthys calabaricus]